MPPLQTTIILGVSSLLLFCSRFGILIFGPLFSLKPLRHHHPSCQSGHHENPIRLRLVMAAGRKTDTDFRHGQNSSCSKHFMLVEINLLFTSLI